MSSTRNPLHRLFGIDIAHHGDLSTAVVPQDATLEVISLGLPRTGTTSLHAALTTLGFGPGHQGIELFRTPWRIEAWIAVYRHVLSGRWKAGDAALNGELRALLRGFRSVTDMPVCFLPEATLAAFPAAKYVLTTRRGGSEAWWRSMRVLMWHLRRDGWRTLFRVAILPVRFIRRLDDAVQYMREVWVRRYGEIGPGIYDGHDQDVRRLVPEGRLLVYDVREGWEPLCKFLGAEVPNEPFPKLNDTESVTAIYTGMMLFGLCAWAMYTVGALALVYLALNPAFTKSGVQGVVDRSASLVARLGLS